MERLFAGEWKKGGIPEKWDGKAAERVVEVLIDLETKGRRDEGTEGRRDGGTKGRRN
jgi:hypothetical protein